MQNVPSDLSNQSINPPQISEVVKPKSSGKKLLVFVLFSFLLLIILSLVAVYFLIFSPAVNTKTTNQPSPLNSLTLPIPPTKDTVIYIGFLYRFETTLTNVIKQSDKITLQIKDDLALPPIEVGANTKIYLGNSVNLQNITTPSRLKAGQSIGLVYIYRDQDKDPWELQQIIIRDNYEEATKSSSLITN